MTRLLWLFAFVISLASSADAATLFRRFAAPAGWTDLGTVVTDQNKTASDPYDVIVDTTVAVGNVIVCAAATDNDGDGTDTNDFNGVSDTNGNTWFQAGVGENERDPGAAGAGAAETLFYSLISTQLTAGTTIAINLVAARTAKAAVCRAFDISGTTVTISGTEQKEDAAGDPGVLTISGLASAQHLCFRGMATEMDATETTTPTSSWTAIQDGTTGSTNTGNMRAYFEFLIAAQTDFTSDPDASVDVADRASSMNCLDQS